MSAWTVEASRLRMRSTPEDARLFAMAVPFDVNSSVISLRSVRTEAYQVMAARGTSTMVRKTMIFVSRPNRMRKLIIVMFPSNLDRRRPVGDRHPAFSGHAREVHGVESLVSLRSERQRRADAEIEIAQRLQRLPECRACGLRPHAAQRLHHHLGVHEPFEADEAEPLHRVAR